MIGAEALLCSVLNCGDCDLKLLDDMKYNWDDVLDQMDFPKEWLNINDLLRAIFSVGVIEINEARDDRIAELEEYKKAFGIESDQQEELDSLKRLDANKDFGCSCNCRDTHIYCVQQAQSYRDYLEPALKNFEDNTGFNIERVWEA